MYFCSSVAADRQILKALSAVQVSLEAVQQEQAAQRRLLVALLKKQASKEPTPTTIDHDIIIKLPLQTVDEVADIERRLTDKEVQAALVGISMTKQ